MLQRRHSKLQLRRGVLFGLEWGGGFSLRGSERIAGAFGEFMSLGFGRVMSGFLLWDALVLNSIVKLPD